MTAQNTQRNYYLETQISGVIAELAVMEGLFYNSETEAGVLLKFVELSCGIGFLSTCSMRSKRLRLVSEQRKTEEQDSRFSPREK